MIRSLLKPILTFGKFSKCTPLLVNIQARNYFPERKLMKIRTGKYNMDPYEAADRVTRIFGIHDHCKNPHQITLSSTFEELGLNDLDLVEICLAVEDEFNIEFTDEQCETFRKVNDVVEAVATNKFVQY